MAAAVIVSGITAVAQGQFPLDVTLTQFRHDTIRTRVELSYAIADTHLLHVPVEQSGVLRCALDLRVIVHSVASTDTFNIILEAFKPANDRNPLLLIGKRELLLLPERYTIELLIRDALRSNSAILRRSYPIVVRSFPNEYIAASSIELAQWIARYDSLNPEQRNRSFVKNDFYVVPLASEVYHGTEPTLYAYTELYNLDRCRCDTIRLRYRVLDAALNEVFDLRYSRPVVGSAQAEILSVSLDGMPSGAYYLSLNIERDAKREEQLARQRFYLVNPEMPPQQPTVLSEDELFLQSPFATMDEAQLAVEVASARFVAGANELDAYNQLTDLAARRRFLFRFWLHRDPDPQTNVNERYEEFRKAREYAAQFYPTPRYPEGWNSDRGRVLLKYGFPTQIDRAYFNMDGAHPHEIWRYDNIQGGVIFVFVDQQGTGNYVLVHSTALYEIRNENWYRQFAMPNYLDPNAPIR
ncbi:MAG: GWxTD domain-containing protein [Chlorobi bacterium]|nr:GWxTD domain-containing protein [Chlorobiota bacterium]